MDEQLYIGLMSGTSLDGIDATLVSFVKDQPDLVAYHSHPFPSKLKKSLAFIADPEWTGTLFQIGTLNQELGHLFAESVNTLLKKNNILNQQIVAIGSHGHTVWHQPTGKLPFSMQLGDANIISENTGITTIADFRSRDIAAGGQGAPLVPAFHHHQLRHPEKNRIILNIGGIANITFLPSKKSKNEVFGFDTGPGNGLMDAWIYKNKGRNFDKYGEWAKSGNTIPEVLTTLLKDPYFSMETPKSTGKETFNLHWLARKINRTLLKAKHKDIQATLLELTATSIANQIPSECDEVFVCGGGVHNRQLMYQLQKQLSNIPINSTKSLGIDPDWMEAIAFAWLAKQNIEGKAGNLPITTGAKGFRLLGATYPRNL